MGNNHSINKQAFTPKGKGKGREGKNQQREIDQTVCYGNSTGISFVVQIVSLGLSGGHALHTHLIS